MRCRPAILVAVVVLAVSPAPAANGAEPPRGTIRWGETVQWAGGPLYGTSETGYALGDLGLCPPRACDDFLLTIRIEPSPNRSKVRFIQVEIRASSPGSVDLVIFPPEADPRFDFTLYEHDIARIVDPQPGQWRIQVRCFPPLSPCAGTTYRGRATTGTLRVPRAVAHRAGGVRVSAPAAGTPSSRPYEVGANGWEPTMGITTGGSMFYQAFVSGVSPKVLRSRDNGRSWQNVSPTARGLYVHQMSFDPYLWLDEETSRVFTLDLFAAGCSLLSFSDDEGDHWTTTPLCDVPDHPTVFGGPPVSSTTHGYPNVLYLCGNVIVATTCSRSLDGGRTFQPAGLPAYAPDAVPKARPVVDLYYVGLTGHGVVGPDGTVFLPSYYTGQPLLAISRNEGRTWIRVQVAHTGIANHQDPQVAADRKGNVYYTWVGADLRPYLAISQDRGRTWGKPMMIGPPGLKEAALSTIDVGAPGKVAIAYLGREESAGKGPAWNGYITMSAWALAARPLFYSSAINDPADPLAETCDANGRCEGVGDFFDVQIAPDGTPWAAFADACVVDRCTPYMGAAPGIVGRLVGGPALR